MKQKGQVVLILLLVLSVGLGIGLSIVQRSLSDLSSSTKVEQSSRAFSAAEAGIEKALINNTSTTINIPPQELNNASANVNIINVPGPGQALEYPSGVSREEIAHIWLANPLDLSSPYQGSSVTLFWGNANTPLADQPAVEVVVVYKDSAGAYKSARFYFDYSASVRDNGFTIPSSPTGKCPSDAITTSSTTIAKTFFCQQQIDLSSISNFLSPVLLRARILYSGTSQAFALAPQVGFSLPRQAKIYLSEGTFSNTHRTILLFKEDRVTPFYFDYAIFSSAEISK